MSTLTGKLCRLRPATLDDAPRLTDILTQPRVATWWGRYDHAKVREIITLTSETVTYAIESDATVIGLIQYSEDDDPDYRHAGIDIALHPDWHGQGIGSDAIATLAWHLFTDLGHHRIVIDPAAANERAIRCYERVGFHKVGVLRRYERGPDGAWHDGMLLDLLPEDLTR